MHYSFFATCSKGLESLLESELRSFSAVDVRQTVAGVFFAGGLETAYRVIMFSRVANRAILLLQQAGVVDADDLYRVASQTDWSQHLKPELSFAISAAGSTAKLNHTQFIAQRVKDAIVDQFRSRGLPRPDVSRTEPDVLIHAVIKQDKLTLGIDLAGESLHRRNYRKEQGEAPLKETLAAALLMRAGWPALSQQPGALLYDPMCGSGTLLIEGVLMAMDIAPGLLRDSSLSRWPLHESHLMDAICAEAKARRDAAAHWEGRAAGSDIDERSVSIARRNAERAGLAERISWQVQSLHEASPPAAPTLVICNPPYAERLGEEPEVAMLYQEFGALLRRTAQGASAAIFTAKPEWGRLLGIHSHKQYAFFNGALPAKLLLFDINEKSIYQNRTGQNKSGQNRVADTSAPAPAESVSTDAIWSRGRKEPPTPTPVAPPPLELDHGAQMFANRLRKNLRTTGRWAEQQGHQCYRLYDADMPEYAFAIDLYGERVHMQEYKAPASVSEEDAALRRHQAFQAVVQVLQISPSSISLKVRERQKGKEQYRPAPVQGEDLVVQEGPARLLVNLDRYLDTGLFLDHRPIRRYIREHAKGKLFLNLFCYTASVTVHAALGGARRSVSVDMSKTYLNWAAQNFALNGISTTQHELVQMDCLRFLKQCHQRFDLVFLDPPTFSNSKNTDNVLDVQRDHGELIDLCMQSLNPGGLLIFSTNHRRFKLDDRLSSTYDVEDYSSQSIDRDFHRNERIHRVWMIRNRAG
jgi:23S rRNA (guanine2445-N2)-methyltransferase / 23S rRNA (guanine2069-N7)-methyltransferase